MRHSQAADPQKLFDTLYPSNYVNADAQPIPPSASSAFRFPTTANGVQLFSYSRGFPAVACNQGSESFNMSFGRFYTPEGTQDYAVHLSILNPYPNNITG